MQAFTQVSTEATFGQSYPQCLPPLGGPLETFKTLMLVDSFRTGSSQKCRDSPRWTFMGNRGQHVVTWDSIWHQCAHLKRHMTTHVWNWCPSVKTLLVPTPSESRWVGGGYARGPPKLPKPPKPSKPPEPSKPPGEVPRAQGPRVTSAPPPMRREKPTVSYV